MAQGSREAGGVAAAGPDRVDRIVAWLLEHRETILAWDYGQIRFDWGPRDVKTVLSRVGKIDGAQGAPGPVVPPPPDDWMVTGSGRERV